MLGGGKRRPNYTSADIQAHLSQITLDASSSSSNLGQPPQENLEHLATIIKSLQDTGTEQLYLRTLDRFVEEKEREIEGICADNYEDFASSVSTLSSVRQGTVHLRRRIGELDNQIGDVGRALGEKKRALLHQKKVSNNVDEAIETLQTCLRVLDLVNRVGEMIKAGKHFGALRALEDLRSLPPTAISQTPFFIHILSSLPSLQAQIKSAVTEAEKSWLFDIRESGAKIGKAALDAMEARLRKWRSRKERDPSLGWAKVGGAIELVTNEKSEFDPLNNSQVSVDFRPLFQAIYIYDALECRGELQRNYQADRKTQADLILSRRAATTSATILDTLPSLMEELVGFFIVENHVLRVTRDFRHQREVNDLWDDMCQRIVKIVGDGLKGCEELEIFLTTKGHILTFMQTLQSYGYDISALTALLMTLFERYSDLLQRKFSADFDQIIAEDDNQPMMVNDQAEFEQVVGVCWLATGEAEQIEMQGFPQAMPFSQTFPMCCINIRNFVDQFYQFVEGVTQNHREIDELLRRSLDGLLITHVSKNICQKLNSMTNLSQIAQIVINIEHFSTACDELETVLMNLRSGQPANSRHTGGVINLQSVGSFNMALELAQSRIDTVIASKLDDFFEMAEYDWTPPLPANMRRKNIVSGVPGQGGRASPAPGQRSSVIVPNAAQPPREPSTYLFEMITFLTAYVDSVLILLSDRIKIRAYRMALEHINKGLLSYLTSPDIPRMNEQALKNLVDDVAFIEKEVKRLDKPGLGDVFDEIKQSISLILSEAVQAYLDPSIRQMSYGAVKPKTLKVVLEKLARWTPDPRAVTGMDADRMSRRRREAETVGKLLAHVH